MLAEGRIGGFYYVGNEAQLGGGCGEIREHEVAGSEEGEACEGGSSDARVEDKEEHLADIVVALDVAQERVPPEDFNDEV